MKAEQIEPKSLPPPFRPVIVTLETQSEVDMLFTMINCVPIVDSLDVGGIYKVLQPFKSTQVNELHNKLIKGMLEWFNPAL